MVKHIRLATEAEIEAIKDKSDLLPGATTVLELDGTLAVLRHPLEVNPVIWKPDASNEHKYHFMFALEERLMGAGADRYYSQIDCADEKWQKVIEHWGYQRVSPQPEYRYLRVIK